MSRRTARSIKARCDRRWSLIVRARAGGRCERCGADGRLEAHHVYGRVDHRLRWEPRNGVALDHVCHRWAEHYPLDFARWFEQTRPADIPFLAAEHRKGSIRRIVADYLILEAELLEMLEGLEAAA